MSSDDQNDHGAPPLVTVIIPAYNAAATLRTTLASVCAQTHRELEVLVVDDGSTDTTASVVRQAKAGDARVQLLQQANGGVARARNAGLAQARGKYVAWIDADDLWHRDKILRQLAVFAASSELPSFVYTGYRLIDEQDRVLPNYRALTEISGHTLCRQIATNFFSNVSSIMVPTELARRVGGYDPCLRDEKIEGAEDLLMQLRLSALGPVACCRAALVGYRMHGANMSADPMRNARSNLRALELIAQEQPLVPYEVLRLGRARLVGYVPMLLSSGRVLEAWRLLMRLLKDQPRWIAEMVCRMAVSGPRLFARSHDDPAIGLQFHQVNPDTALWTDQMLLTNRQGAWLKTCDARLQDNPPFRNQASSTLHPHGRKYHGSIENISEAESKGT